MRYGRGSAPRARWPRVMLLRPAELYYTHTWVADFGIVVHRLRLPVRD